MLLDDQTGVSTLAAVAVLFAGLWVIAVGSFAYGVAGLLRGWPARRVYFATRAGVTLAVMLCPIFTLFGWAVIREAFVELGLDPGHYFWLVVAGIGMPAALLVAIVGSWSVLKTVRQREGGQVSRGWENGIGARGTLRGSWTTLIALGLCAQLVAYVGSYVGMSADGQFWLVANPPPGEGRYAWIPNGFVTSEATHELNDFLHAVYLPLWILDNEFVHPGEDAIGGYNPFRRGLDRIRL